MVAIAVSVKEAPKSRRSRSPVIVAALHGRQPQTRCVVSKVCLGLGRTRRRPSAGLISLPHKLRTSTVQTGRVMSMPWTLVGMHVRP